MRYAQKHLIWTSKPVTEGGASAGRLFAMLRRCKKTVNPSCNKWMP